MPAEKLVAIHQPSFLPWLGFFDKIIRSDIFVILDDVQFPKTGGFWSNRVKILIDGKEHWLTVPVVRSYKGTRLINEMEINNTTGWMEKIVKSIEINYRKASFFDEVFPFLKDLLFIEIDNLCEYNLSIIYSICNLLGIDTAKMIKSSSLPHNGTATDLLISIIGLTEGTAYMCGGGASKYQEDDKFKQAGINLIYQSFKHPQYPQFNSKVFIPGLSIIDAMMNIGTEAVKKMVVK